MGSIEERMLDLLRRWAVMGDVGHPLASQELLDLRKETRELLNEHPDNPS